MLSLNPLSFRGDGCTSSSLSLLADGDCCFMGVKGDAVGLGVFE